jgi:hypothetical protein
MCTRHGKLTQSLCTCNILETHYGNAFDNIWVTGRFVGDYLLAGGHSRISSIQIDDERPIDFVSSTSFITQLTPVGHVDSFVAVGDPVAREERIVDISAFNQFSRPFVAGVSTYGDIVPLYVTWFANIETLDTVAISTSSNANAADSHSNTASNSSSNSDDSSSSSSDSKMNTLSQVALYVVVPLVILISLLSGLAFLVFLVRRGNQDDDGYMILQTM